ncbi:hypothetical protein [Clostridium baratii]|uniref:hypothetical protein n=1 Tax=Clostridium baratii TaxID=1561 RepID=UPI0006BB2746|nr:hypothetical protein [Clostridium baratii]
MDEEKIKRAYKYLVNKYPNIPSIRPEVIKTSIENEFGLTDKEVYSAYYSWKRKVTGIIERPKFKCINNTRYIKESFIWSKNTDKLKELHERYKMGEDAEDLAAEIMVEKENLLNAFTRYKRMGVLHGERKFKRSIIRINGKEFSTKKIMELVERINSGEKLKDLAEELKVDVRYLSNTYYHYRKKFTKK